MVARKFSCVNSQFVVRIRSYLNEMFTVWLTTTDFAKKFMIYFLPTV